MVAKDTKSSDLKAGKESTALASKAPIIELMPAIDEDEGNDADADADDDESDDPYLFASSSSFDGADANNAEIIDADDFDESDDDDDHDDLDDDDDALTPEVILPIPRKKDKAISKKDDASPTGLLQKYFQEIRRYPLLTPEEEYDIATRFQSSQSSDLAFRLTTANLRLVVKIAMDYQSAVANLLDLIQEGNVGLMQAVKKFDPYKGLRLSTYAQWWIRAYILKYLVNNARLVKIGTTQAQRKLFFNLRKERDRLEALGFKPEPALLAKHLDVREEEVKEMEQRLARSDLSLDLPLGDDQKSTVGDLMPGNYADAEELVIDNELKQRVRDYMNEFAKTLKKREIVLWEKRLTADDPLTLQELGDQFGVTRERARQIEKEIVRRFHDFLHKQIPDLNADDLLSNS